MKKLLSVILLFSIATFSFAGKVKFVAKTSNTVVEVGQRFQITYSINSSGGNFTPPSFSDFDMNRFAGQSSSTQIVNGKMTQTYSLNYVLASNRPGKYKIEPATINIDGENYQSNTLEIEVIEGNPNGANAQKKRQANRKSGGKDLNDYIYMDVFLDKKEAYVGEKITATFKMYTQLPVSRVNPEKLPDLKGFWSENITDYNNMRLNEVNKSGEIWQVADVQQIVLFPQRSGELILDPLEVNTIVQVRTRKARSIWDEMMGGGYENKELIISSPEVKLNIKALPNGGKTADFNGAVGQFKMNFSANKTTVKANEAIDVKITVSGSGNLNLMGAPDLSFPPDFESYDPEVSSNIKTTASGTKGSKTFSYLIIPRHSGTFELDPYTFTYFDPTNERYQSIAAPPLTITVEKGEETEEVVYTQRQKEEIAVLNTDIKYIHGSTELIKADERFFGSALFYLLIGLSIGLLLAVYYIAKKMRSKSKDIVGSRKSKANKVAKKRLKQAKAHLEAKENAAFYQEIGNALFGYFSDKYNLDRSELSQERILSEIQDESIKAEVKNTLDTVEMARYAPSSATAPQQLYDQTIELISKSEKA